MKNENNFKVTKDLHLKVEELVKEVLLDKLFQLSESDTLKLLKDIKLQKVALELQNEELKKIILQVVTAIKIYTELFDFKISAFLSLSREGKILELNHGGFQLLGIKSIKQKDISFVDLVSADSKPVFRDFLKGLLNGKRIRSCEVALSIKGNLPILVYLTGVVIEHGDQCLIAVFNISDHKQTVEALLQSEERLLTLSRTIPDLSWLQDSCEMISSCNRELESLFTAKGKVLEHVFGVKGFEIVGKDDYDFVDRKLAKLFLKHVQKALVPNDKNDIVTSVNYEKHFLSDIIKSSTSDSCKELCEIPSK